MFSNGTSKVHIFRYSLADVGNSTGSGGSDVLYSFEQWSSRLKPAVTRIREQKHVSQVY